MVSLTSLPQYLRRIVLAAAIATLPVLCPSWRPSLATECPPEGQDPARPPASSTEATLGITTNLVIVNVTIRDQMKRFVRSLARKDFRIREDGIDQEILSFELAENPAAVAILLDASGSMENKLSLVRAACSLFVEGLNTGDSYSIFSFGDSKVRQLQKFTEIRDIPDAVWDLRARGQTSLYDAIVTASAALAARPERRRAMLIVSDGADTQSRASLDEATRRAVDAHLVVYAVDLSDSTVFGQRSGLESGAGVLRSLTTRTGGRFFTSPGGGRLREAFAETIEELRHQYSLTYDSSNEKRDGRWRKIEVEVARPNLELRTRQGYWAAKGER